jgi:chitinase
MPYSCSWKVPSTLGVWYTFETRAYTAAGVVASDSIHVISGYDTTRPVVAFTNVSEGSHVTAGTSFTLSASASDEVGVTKVEFYINGSRKCTDKVAPYTCNWSVSATAGVAYTLEVRAYDAAGNIGSSVVHVTSQ